MKFSRNTTLLTWLCAGALSCQASAQMLTPFHSDGCSRFPDGTPEQPTLWRHCCAAHDAAYWAGGTEAQKRLADQQLAQCVSDAGQAGVARLMLTGVAVGGQPFWPTPFRWGFGWPQGRGYAPLSPEEQAQVRAGWPAEIALPAWLANELSE